jgi:hypothetical protein
MEQLTTFDPVHRECTPQALELSIPATLLQQATEIIQ